MKGWMEGAIERKDLHQSVLSRKTHVLNPSPHLVSAVDSQTGRQIGGVTGDHRGTLEWCVGGGGIMLVTRNFRVIISNYQFMDINEQYTL